MKARNIVVAAAAALLASAACRADYLYWMYDPVEQGEGADHSLAQLYYTPNGTYNGTSLGSAEYVALGGSVGSATNPIETDLAVFRDYLRSAAADPDHFSFYVEIITFGVAGQVLSQSDSALWLYSDLAVANYIKAAGWDAPSMAAPVANFAAVPEPTGGVLVLLGGALLALRRRRLAAA